MTTERARIPPPGIAYGVRDVARTDVRGRARTEAHVSGATCVGSDSEACFVVCTEASWRLVEALHAWGVARHARRMALVATALEAVMLKARVSDSFCVGLGSNLG
ncbi:hypothetical protein ERO13_D07G175950v2 [Gossypium hirsutum]|uniref:Uncharacterized protein n=1 Tax=Gossypium hirsutum TaxID=3635 RepID=A0ABM3ACG4_GOSHI|nr:uncharacterized protein LOC121219075 [Gossypium hirsutum]KAG4139189.1 hypothetical protein ERO13_D07G175950v2 [Gossypium hirsutum]